ncbi:MAG: hypothetical protein ABIG30_00045 [Candidatus Aenigmatarchaeota archaeon]
MGLCGNEKKDFDMNSDFNIVKIDSKGRILVPFHIRNYIDLDEDSEVMIINNGKKEIKIIPIVAGENASMSAMIKDTPGALAKTLDVLSKHKVDILASRSKTLEKGKHAEWSAILDVSQCKDIKKFHDEMKELDVIEKVEVEVK